MELLPATRAVDALGSCSGGAAGSCGGTRCGASCTGSCCASCGKVCAAASTLGGFGTGSGSALVIPALVLIVIQPNQTGSVMIARTVPSGRTSVRASTTSILAPGMRSHIATPFRSSTSERTKSGRLHTTCHLDVSKTSRGWVLPPCAVALDVERTTTADRGEKSMRGGMLGRLDCAARARGDRGASRQTLVDVARGLFPAE